MKKRTAEISASYATVPSPIGNLVLVADAGALLGIYFEGYDHIPAASRSWKRDGRHPILQKAAAQLGEYFAGRRTAFSLPLRLAGTEFQEKVWRQIARIPYGKTISYGDLAQRAGAPRAIRAAGTTTGRNPLAIVIPCHRVMGKQGGLCGFAGGLDKKRKLLAVEKIEIGAAG